MDIIKTWPPNIKEIRKVFNLEGEKPMFCYGKVIYAPYGIVDSALMHHEATHSIQQENIGGPVKWWKKYLTDKEFRLDQEIPAYQNQYKRFCELHTDRNLRFRYLHVIAKGMASEMYGNMVEYSQALQLIKN